MQEVSRSDASLLGLVESLVLRRRLILGNVILVVSAAVLISLLLPKWYRSTAVILPPETPVDPLTTLGALQTVSATANLPWFATTADIYSAILKSRLISEKIIEQFDLLHVYRVDSMEKAIRILDKRRMVRVTEENLIELTIEDRDPARAAEIANALFSALDEFNKITRMTEGKKTLLFVEERLLQTGEELAAAEKALRDFQEQHRAVELTEQTRVLISAAAEIESQILAIDVRLATLGSYATVDHPEIRLLRTERADLKRHLQDLLGTTRVASDGFEEDDSAPFPTLERVPELGMEYLRLKREVEIKSKVQVFLSQELERAKIMASRDTPTIERLGIAVPPEKKFRPKRTLIVLIALAASLLGSIVLALGLDSVDRWLKQSSETSRLGRIAETLREDWSGWRKTSRPRE